MSIDPNKCCGEHTKEKEESGTCCQTKENEAPVKQEDECYPGQASET